MKNIRKGLKEKSNMSDAAMDELLSSAIRLEVPKKHILASSLKKDGNVYFIEKGIARTYCMVEGKEITYWFSPEGDITYVTNEFYGHKIRGYENEYIQLLENAILYYIPIRRLEELYKTNIEIANWGRMLHQDAFIKNGDRLFSRLYLSAEERYRIFLKENPTLFQRVNLGYIASYLGFSQVTLSLLRNKAR